MEGRVVLIILGSVTLIHLALGDVLFITAPNIFHHGNEESVSVNVLGLDGGVTTVDIYLQDHPHRAKTFSRKQVQVDTNRPKLTTVKVEPGDMPEAADPALNQYVYLVAEATETGFKKETLVLVSSNSHHIFIQTDKPLYTPKETVYGRVFTMGHDMKPDNDPIRVDIVNPQGIVIHRKVDQQADDGIINIHFTFPEIVIDGIWSIVASYGHQASRVVTAKFEVKEYVLPTFSVKITAPEFLLPTDTRIVGFIEAKHTYGKAVAGRARVEFWVVMRQTRRHLFTSTKKLTLNGEYAFSVEMAEMNDLGEEYQFPNLEGAKLHIEATVTEVYTGKSMTSISKSTVFASSPYAVRFPRSSMYFKPALPYVLRIDSKYANGKTAGRIAVQVTATAETAAGGNIEVSGYNNHQNQVTTDEEGRAQFTLDIPRDARTLSITVKTADPNLENAQQGRAVLTTTAYSSPSNSFLLVRTTAQIVRVEDILEAEVFITNFNDVTSISYMVIGRGRILYQQTQETQAGIVTTLHISVTPEMSPSVRLLVYYVSGDDEVVADSVWVDVVDQCQNQVILEPSKQVFKPGEDAHVTITGTPGSKVALLAVDQAVYILNDKNSLTRDIMFKRMDDFDLGCTPGGGANSQGVFQDAGMTTVNNAGLTVPQRPREGCFLEADSRRKRSIASVQASDIQACCRRGRSPLHASAHTVRNCRIRAATLTGVTNECINTFFQCCKKSVSSSAEGNGRNIMGRLSGENENMDYEFKLIEVDEDEIPVRSKFPQSWLFLTQEIGDQGQLSQRVTFPDSITSWTLQAVGVSPTTGMCVAQASNVTVFKEYFLQLDMPYSAVSGEQIEVKATLYNYRSETLRALVFLKATGDICYGARTGENTEEIRLSIPANQAKHVAWPIIPLSTGEFLVRVKAFTNAGGDIVEKKLLVVPAGVQKVESRTIVLDPNGELRVRRDVGGPVRLYDGRPQFVSIPLVLPEETVPGSAHCSVSVTAEMMGPVTKAVVDGESLDTWIREPTGCGEQTMSKLGPLVSVAKYLKETGQMTGEKETQLYALIRQGVQHVLSFRKPEGGFSVWTSSSPRISLTAFAAKILSQAREFNALDGDPSDVICKAVEWLSQKQQSTGAYPYGVDRTAYVLVAMLETFRYCETQEIQASISRTVTYLERQVPQISGAYRAAIVAYALALADSERKDEANDKLRELAFDDIANNFRFWPDSREFANQNKSYWYAKRPSATEILTASYAILTQLENDDLDYANPIVNWLASQRNYRGAFISTQDTVIGLQALSEYNIRTRHTNTDLKCLISSAKDQRFKREISVNERNADVRQEVEVTSVLGGDLFIDTEGEGVGQVQVELVYNVHSVAQEQCRFNLTVNAEEFDPTLPGCGGNCDEDPYFDPENGDFEDFEDESGTGFVDRNMFDLARVGGRSNSRIGRNDARADARLRAGRHGASHLAIKIRSCVQYLGAVDTGMSILDVGFFTGFVPVTEDLEALKNSKSLGIGRYEVNDRSVVFYLDTVPKDKQVCISFTLKREFNVGMTHAVGISVYDYYEPSEKCTKFYHPSSGSPLLMKMCDGNQCVCAEGKCGTCYGFEHGDTPPLSFVQLFRKACSKGLDYALKIVIESIQYDIAFEIVKARVIQVIKRGAEDIQRQQEINFWKKADCVCPFLELGLTYYVTGRDGLPVENEAGDRKYKYMLDEGAYVIKYMDRRDPEFPRGTAEWNQARDQHKFQRELSRRGCGF